MSQTQTGDYAVVWGANVGVAYDVGAVAVAAGNSLAQDFTLDMQADEFRLKDGDGNTKTIVHSDFGKMLTITVIPVSETSISDANDKSLVPIPGTAVTLSLKGDEHDQITENHSGKYLAMAGCQLQAANGGQPARITMNLYQNTATDLTAAIS